MSAKTRFWIEKQLKERNCPPRDLFLDCYILRYGYPSPERMRDIETDARAFVNDAYVPPYVEWVANEGGNDAGL